MKVTVDYKGKSVEVTIPDETLEILTRKEPKPTGWEKPKHGQQYWFITSGGEVDFDIWFGIPLDHDRYNSGNCYVNEKLAKDMCRYRKLDNQIRRRIAEICKPVDWKSRTWKSDIVYLHEEGKVVCGSTMTAQSAPWCCDTEEHCKQIIEEFKDELTWYFTEFHGHACGLLEG